MIAIDSLHGGNAVRSFHHDPPPIHRLSSSFDADKDRQTALIAHLKKGLLDGSSDSPYGEFPAEIKQLLHIMPISLTLIPFDMAKKSMALLGRMGRVLEDTAPQIAWRKYGFGVDKLYGELLTKFYDAGAFLARSNFGVERTLFYYEAAAAAGIPVVLHPARNEEDMDIKRTCQDAYNVVKEKLRKSFEESINAELVTLGIESSITLPPLIAAMIRMASTNRMSIIEAARTIKESNEAQLFRKWLSEIQSNLIKGTLEGKMRVLKMLRELDKVVVAWKESLDLKAGVVYKKRRLRFAWIPRIGALLEMLDGMDIRDPILRRKGYLTFISSLYRDEVMEKNA